jgi:hypothetical protein
MDFACPVPTRGLNKYPGLAFAIRISRGGPDKASSAKGYFVSRFSEPFTELGVANGGSTIKDDLPPALINMDFACPVATRGLNKYPGLAFAIRISRGLSLSCVVDMVITISSRSRYSYSFHGRHASFLISDQYGLRLSSCDARLE